MLHLILGLSFCNVILHPQKFGITYIKVILEAPITKNHISNPNHFFSMWWLPARTMWLKCRSYSTFLQLYLEERWLLWGHLTASCQYVRGICQGEWASLHKAVHDRMMTRCIKCSERSSDWIWGAIFSWGQSGAGMGFLERLHYLSLGVFQELSR